MNHARRDPPPRRTFRAPVVAALPTGLRFSLFVQLGSVVGPNGANGRLVARTVWDCVALVVGKIPAGIRRSCRAAAGHLEMGIGIRIPQPVPGVLQPLGAILLGLVRKPGDFVIAPDVEPFVGTGGLSLMPTRAEVVEFHEIGQMLAGPAAE